jgi:hypothetical protein
MNAQSKRKTLKPAHSCVICNKTLDQIGGRRLVAQQLRGITLSNKYQGGGNKDYSYKSFKFSEDSDDYVVVWGEKSLWEKAAINRAISDYQAGKRPWFCQKCGLRGCSTCGEPINYPMGSGVIDGNGCYSHCPIHPIDPGCINKSCSKYKEFDL